MEVSEARKGLEACFSEDVREEYFDVLDRYKSFVRPLTKVEFCSEISKFVVTPEQTRCHNRFILALIHKESSVRMKHMTNFTNESVFENPEFSDYVFPLSPMSLPPEDLDYRSAAGELFMPDSGFLSIRVALISGRNGLDGATDPVTDLMVHSCQVFVRNIITAMVSRIKGYKIREKRFQYGFNLPVPDPFIRNSQNIVDETQELKTEVVYGEDTFIPRSKPSMDNAEQQAAFQYSCAKKRKSNNVLTVKLLYEALKDNPHVLGLHELHSCSLFNLGLQLENI